MSFSLDTDSSVVVVKKTGEESDPISQEEE